jgi:cytokinin dehydrogenase
MEVAMSNVSRRGILKGLVAGTIVLGFDPVGRSWVTEANAGGPMVGLPPLDGTLTTDPADLAAAADDWGHIVHRTPIAVLKPGSVHDIVAMVKYAKAHGIRIAGRGRGHTVLGQSQTVGLQIDLGTLDAIHSISSSEADVDAGVIWRDLLLATTAIGRTPPVVPSFLNLTVGGTLSVGGIGTTSFRHGAQIDNVSELVVVTGDGDLVTCSEKHHEDLFEAALGGLGLCAIIVRATVKLVHAEERAKVYDLVYRTVVQDGRFDALESITVPTPTGWGYILEAVTFYTPDGDDDADDGDDPHLLDGLGFIPGATQITDETYFEYADSIDQLVDLLGTLGLNALPHPWLDLFVPGSQIDAFAAQALSQLDPAQFLPGSLVAMYSLKRSKLTRPLLQVPDEPVFFLFDILRTVAPDPAVVSAALAENRGFYDQNFALGGREYAISAVDLSTADWKAHFGPAWKALAKAKKHYDSDNVLGAGTNIFP